MGRAPFPEPSRMSLPPLMQSCRDELEAAHDQVRAAGARAARLEIQVGELEQRLSAIGAEISQIQSEPAPRLSTELEHGLEPLRQHDRNVAPLYRHLDLARESAPWADAIEGLLDHLDMLTLLTISIPLDAARSALGDAVDWHVLVASPAGGKAAKGSV